MLSAKGTDTDHYYFTDKETEALAGIITQP